MNYKLTVLFIILGGLLVALSQSLFVVDQREKALVLQLGKPIGDPRSAGLHFKIPLVQDVIYFDSRILPVDPDPEQVVISSDKVVIPEPPKEGAEAAADETDTIRNVSGEPIIVDTFARYKISDPLQFYKTLRTISRANDRLERILNDATRSVLGSTTLQQLLSSDRGKIMNAIKTRVNRATREDQLGIEIVDVRIVRADLTSDLRTSTVRRMISELNERATETRAKGEERAKEIRSTAEKERTVLIAEAERDAQILRGEGDREAIKIYADAFNKDKDFYAFIRTMEAYGNTLSDPGTQIILTPESDFFRYFDSQSGR